MTVETAAQKRLNTFGASVNVLTEEVFNKNESIADYSLATLNEIKNRKFKNLSQIQQAKEDARILGDSVEKTLLFRKLLMLEDVFRKKEIKPVKKKDALKNAIVKKKIKKSVARKRAVSIATKKIAKGKSVVNKPATKAVKKKIRRGK